jgi:hypothetical protein
MLLFTGLVLFGGLLFTGLVLFGGLLFTGLVLFRRLLYAGFTVSIFMFLTSYLLCLSDEVGLVLGDAPHGLKDDSQVIADGELVIELTAGPSTLHL